MKKNVIYGGGAPKWYEGIPYYFAAGQAAYLASKQNTKRPNSYTKTATESKKKPRRVMRKVRKAYYGGKYKSRPFPKPKRLTRKLYKRAFNGVQRNIERTATVTDDKCVYLAHSTFPATEILKQAVYAIVKRLYNNMSIYFSSFEENFVRTANNWVIAAYYKPSITAAVTSTSYTIAVGDSTYKNVADGFYLAILNNMVNSAGGFTMQSILQMFSILDTSGNVISRLNALDSTLSVFTKSSLKMQNRSVNVSTDNEEGDINNVPLTGRGYEGRGNGFVTRDLNLIMTPCSLDYGWTSFGAGTTNNLQEPPQVYHLQYAKGVRTANIQPGTIKTSILVKKEYMNMNRFLGLLNGLYIAATDTNQYHTIGRVRMFAFERAIARMAGDASPGITVITEHDLKLWVDVKLKRGGYVGPDNFVS